MTGLAIVGLDCLFPGAPSPDALWELLRDGRRVIRPATAAEWGVDPRRYLSADPEAHDHTPSLDVAWLDDPAPELDGLDLPADWLCRLDRAFGLSLHVARRALADAPPLDRARCGLVLAGYSWAVNSASEAMFRGLYDAAVAAAGGSLTPGRNPDLGEPANGGISGLTAAVVARALGLTGPRLSLDAACASTLYAMELAGRYLRAGLADTMVVVATSASDPLFSALGFGALRALPSGAPSRPLDERSTGLCQALGACAFVLRRAEDAPRHHGLVRAIGLSNDGRGRSLLAPDVEGQVDALRRAYAAAGLTPDDVPCVECHATGTPVGDRSELDALRRVFGDRPRLGAIKSNLGHLLPAAAGAGVIKCLLALRHGELPPTVGVERPLRASDGGQPDVPRVTTPWAGPRRAGVNAFGFGGANAHAIVELEGDSTPAPLVPAPMAIVGLDGALGSSIGREALQRRWYEGVADARPLPPGRWRGLEACLPAWRPGLLPEEGLPAGSWLDRFVVDALRLKLPPQEIERMNPQQIVLLAVADAAIRDAGLRPGGRVAVLIGNSSELSIHRVQARWELGERLGPHPGLDAARGALHPPTETGDFTSWIGNLMASRVASLWDFHGPALTIAAEESSGLRALELASLLLADPELEAVVIGAVDLAGGIESFALRASEAAPGRGPMGLSFEAPGWRVGEGAGALVLTRLDDARRAGRTIYARVAGLHLETDPAAVGPGGAIAASTVARAARAALGELDPAAVGYVEAHASGLVQEDAAELAGLIEVYGPTTRSPQERGPEAPPAPRSVTGGRGPALGSAKAIHGHTQAASGVVGLLRAALALHHRYLPPVAASRGALPLEVPTEPRPWLQAGLRYAAVSSLSRDGVVGHAVLAEEPAPAALRAPASSPSRDGVVGHAVLAEEPAPAALRAPVSSLSRDGDIGLAVLAEEPAPAPALRAPRAGALHLVPVTAPTPAALDAALAALETGGEPLGLRSARALAQLDAPAAGLRVVLVARDLAGLAEEARLARRGVPQAVTAGGAWATPAGSRFTAAPTGGEVCFVYPGLQALYPGAGRDLLQLHPAAHAALAAALRDPGAALRLPDLYPRLATPEDREEAEDALLADPHALIQAGVGVSVLQTRLLREALGLRPTSALGYSLGELTMLVALDMWPLSDALHEALRRSEVLREELAGPRRAVARAWGEDAPAWEVWTLLTSRSRVEALQVPRVSWSLTPCDGEVVIAGHPEGCRAVIDALGCPAIAMPQGLAVHSPFVASAAAALARDLERPVQDPGLVLRTNGSDDGRMPLDAAGCAQALARSVCAPFDLPRLVEQAWADGARVFIEVGPGATCSRWIGATLAGRPHLAVSVDQRGVDDHSGLARLLAALLAHGVPVDLRGWIAGLDRGHAGTVPREVSLGGPSIPQALRVALTSALAPPAALSADMTPAVAPSAPPISDDVASPIAAHPTLARAIHAAGRRAADAHLALLDARLRTLAGLRLAPFPDQPDARSRSAIHRERGPAAPQIPPSQRSVSKEGPVQGERWGSAHARPALDEAQVQAFANGRVQDALGPAWADVDALPRRLRTPSPPFLAISRVLRLEGEPRSLGTGRVSTELDLPRPSWYGVEGQVPWFALDAQGVLILASWLGVDTVNRGLRVFRWLDATITFEGDMPREGETIRYDISIDRFLEDGDSLLFFSTYRGTVGGRPLLRIDGCCAGFFTDEALRAGAGILPKHRTPRSADGPPPPLPPGPRALDRAQLVALTQGRLADALGPAFADPHNPALRLPPEALLFVDRVQQIDPRGGRCGRGFLLAQKDLDPDHWYLRSHFIDDNVFAGPCMIEGSLQLLQVFLLLAQAGRGGRGGRFLPTRSPSVRVCFRGQIPAGPLPFTYALHVVDWGLHPEPYVIADVDLIYDGRTQGVLENLGLTLVFA